MTSDDGQLLSNGDGNVARDLISPLSALRLSKGPLHNKQDKEQKARKNDYIPKIRQNDALESRETQGDIITSDIKNLDDFDFDIELDNDVIFNQNKVTDNAHDKEKLKKASELALIFLDTRKLLKADQNVIDPMNNQMNDGHTRGYIGNDQANGQGNSLKINRSTSIRAEKVKTMIGLKYLCIQKNYDWLAYNADNNMHPGVEGIYNPIQVIRNRKIRAKYHEYPKLLTVKTLPLASNVFSSHNKHRSSKRQWKMIWAVELNELISDLSWRQLHWNELRKSNGDLWFPDSPQGSIHTSRIHRGRQKLHDKLFLEDDTDNTLKEKYKGPSENLLVTSIETESGSTQNSTSKGNHPTRQKIKDQIKKHSRGFYYSSPSSSQSSTLAKEGHEESKSNNYGDRLSLKVNDSHTSSLKNSKSDGIVRDNNELDGDTNINTKGNHKYSQSLATPIIKVEDNYLGHGSLLNLQIKPTHKRNSSTDKLMQIDLSANEKKDGTQVEQIENVEEAFEQENQESLEIFEVSSDLNYFNAAHIIKLNYLKFIYPSIMQSIEMKLNRIINQQLPEITQLSFNIDENYMSAYEMFYSGFLNEIKSLTHLINDDYSIKIDNLLSNSDRSIGEINTSLSLELRKANERVDKLNSSLFGNIVTQNLKDSDFSMNSFSDTGDYKILYLLLENFIVILLRIIWVIANIYRLFRFIIRTIWKILWYIISVFS